MSLMDDQIYKPSSGRRRNRCRGSLVIQSSWNASHLADIQSRRFAGRKTANRWSWISTLASIPSGKYKQQHPFEYMYMQNNNNQCLFVCLFAIYSWGWSGPAAGSILRTPSWITKQDPSGGERQLGHHQIGGQRPGTIRLCGPEHGRHPRDLARLVDSQR